MARILQLHEFGQRPKRKSVSVPEFVGPHPCNNKRNVADIDEWIESEPAILAYSGKLHQ